ncbi:MAG: hypothetical protein ACRCYX_02710 [Dermatophilaceae bacterium]
MTPAFAGTTVSLMRCHDTIGDDPRVRGDDDTTPNSVPGEQG